MRIVKVSPKGQITIPKAARDRCTSNQYLFEMKGATIVLKPVTITIVEDTEKNFEALSEKSFDFWNNKKDDIYGDFYNA